MQPDERGLPLTTNGAEAARAFDGAVNAYLGFRRDAGDRLKAVFAADADMPMAHCLKGYFFLLMGNRALVPRAAKVAEAARQAADARGATARERLHVDALDAWVRSDLVGAAHRLEAVLKHHPLDVVAAKLAHYLHFYLGHTEEHRDSVARILHAWDEGVPGYGYVLGMRAFGLEEAGEYTAAEECGRRAVEIDPTDTWAIHAVAHVMEMQGRQREGIEWVRLHEPEWEGVVHNFANHVWWHQALYHLELGEHDAVLDLYDRRFWREPSEDPLDIANATSMLMRLDFAGVDVGSRWDMPADVAARHVEDQVLPFADAHYAMALGRCDPDAADGLLSAMAYYAGKRDDTVADVLRGSGLRLAEAVVAFGRGDWARVVERLEPVRYEVRRVGGSHAQRDVFAHMLAVAALRAGDHATARALFAERTANRPWSRSAWEGLAEAFRGEGDVVHAIRAAERADALTAA